MLCGSTHGASNTALRAMTRAPVDSGDGGMTIVMPANDPLSLIPMLGVVIQAYYRANDRRFAFFGWDARPWDRWKLQVMPTVIELMRAPER
jgi:hypothetical protein